MMIKNVIQSQYFFKSEIFQFFRMRKFSLENEPVLGLRITGILRLSELYRISPAPKRVSGAVVFRGQ